MLSYIFGVPRGDILLEVVTFLYKRKSGKGLEKEDCKMSLTSSVRRCQNHTSMNVNVRTLRDFYNVGGFTSV